MAKNRFAQPLYGKIIYIYETDLRLDQLSTIFDPSVYWIDVTDMDCEVGYVIDFVEGGGLRFIPPSNDGPFTLEEEKTNLIAQLKVERDKKEAEIIEYNDIILDYDEKARERMSIAKDFLIDNEVPYITWTCADNTRAVLTAEDFKNINTLAAQRSNTLHEKYNALKDYIETLETKEELEGITMDTVIPDDFNNTEEVEEEQNFEEV